MAGPAWRRATLTDRASARGLRLRLGARDKLFGRVFSEPTLIELASGYEAFTQSRAKRPSSFAPMAPNYGIAGTARWNPSREAHKAPAREEKDAPHHL